jgi:hypothetical protein
MSGSIDTFCSAITASIELEVLRQRDKYEYIFHDEIVSRLGRFTFDVGNEELEPDRAFGIRYKQTGGVRLFLIEADRGTEQNKKRKGRKSHQGNIQLYYQFIGQGIYKKYFGEQSRLMLIAMFSSPRKMENVREMTGNSAFTLFQSWPTFSRFFKPPKPRPDLFTGPWLRAGMEPFFINQL